MPILESARGGTVPRPHTRTGMFKMAGATDTSSGLSEKYANANPANPNGSRPMESRRMRLLARM